MTIEQHADAILRAAGSSLRHYETQARIDIIEGVHDVYAAAYEAGRKAGWTAFEELMMVQLGPYMPDVRKEPHAGYVVVPREATEAMLIDGAARQNDFMSEQGPYPRTKAVWSAMLSAAPKIQHSEGE